MDRLIRDRALKEYPLHQNQHAYQTGKSTETALHDVVTRVERQLNTRIFPLVHSLA
jgi:hypothetical protein